MMLAVASASIACTVVSPSHTASRVNPSSSPLNSLMRTGANALKRAISSSTCAGSTISSTFVNWEITFAAVPPLIFTMLKSNSLERLLFGLGIRHVGSKTAKLICQKFKTIDNIINSSFEDIASINGVGEVIAMAVKEYFDNLENLELINELKLLGLNTNFIESTVKESYFSNKKIVLTGTLSSMGRDEAKSKIEEFGGVCVSSVSKNTNIVIYGEGAGSKYDKAVSLGIELMTEDEFLNMIGE